MKEQDLPQPKSKYAKFFAYLFLVFGVLNFIDWLYAGHADYEKAFKGLGFMLIAPAAFADAYSNYAQGLKKSGITGMLRPMTWLGALLIVVGLALPWL